MISGAVDMKTCVKRWGTDPETVRIINHQIKLMIEAGILEKIASKSGPLMAVNDEF